MHELWIATREHKEHIARQENIGQRNIVQWPRKRTQAVESQGAAGKGANFGLLAVLFWAIISRILGRVFRLQVPL